MQSVPQLIPGGFEVTVPLPVPAFVIVSVRFAKLKVAVTLRDPDIVTWQVPVPLQPPPLHPAKTELLPGVAVSVTTVPLS